jgi:HSP20 family protein
MSEKKDIIPVFKNMLSLQEGINSLFNDFFGSSFPLIDVKETDKTIDIVADIPGFTEKDIEVTIDGDVLVLKGNKNEEKEKKDENYYYKERVYNSFYRQIQIPKKVDTDQIKATFKDGTLTINLPKSEKYSVIKIEVNK